ncbi:NAD(P)/FAD-dependent oxidoreductase [Dethiosulfatarculus sandiegensis]|uniref:Pyridine nucleotide-disulfide oxidoreductase n=1 Tax=Dethiosulfatarculus sandiegensis TaxID=1429043 RepID=A0A0D2GEY7_9BACT|nr:FAD-dependent oxidoreductase [Dethiosulfatarculus sandiegensis]KIX13482.1 hypothetical protein X474_13435 [Dethiosulfatarculus sandiegensis]
MSNTSYVLVGNSAAAVGAVAGIRQYDPRGSVTIIAKEPEHTYSRPLISYLLAGKVDEKRMYYRPLDFYRKSRVQALLGTLVTEVLPDRKVVKTSDGQEVLYDRLLLATGGKPVVPPNLKGVETGGVFTFTSWQDARRIKEYIDKYQVRDAVVLGGGLIGLKSVEALTALGIKTTVLELAERVLSITLDQTASDLVAGALEKKGVDLLCTSTVEAIHSRRGKVSGVTVTGGEKIECGLVLLAIGVQPDTTLAMSAGLKVDRGILVDDYLRTSEKDIFAAGDVAQAMEMLSGEKRAVPIWPLAYRQGLIAGSNMAGHEMTYEGSLAMNSVEICGLPTISAGITSPEGEDYEVLTKKNKRTGAYKKIVFKDDRLVGFIMTGDIERAGIMTGLIKGRVKIGGLKKKLMGDDFGVINLPFDYRAQVAAGKGVYL